MKRLIYLHNSEATLKTANYTNFINCANYKFNKFIQPELAKPAVQGVLA